MVDNLSLLLTHVLLFVLLMRLVRQADDAPRKPRPPLARQGRPEAGRRDA